MMEDIKQEPDNLITIYEVYDEGESIDAVHACRVCLLTDCKLYPLAQLNKENSYMQVSGLSPHDDERLPRSLCAECYTLLNKCMQFREKSRMGYQCLMKILENHSKITVDIIKQVNRKKFKLNSNLTIIRKKPNFDYQFVDESDVLYNENKIKQERLVEYNTYKDEDSTESDLTETTNIEIDVPFESVKKRKTKHIKAEKITFENVVTDNVAIDIDENLKVEPGISVVRNRAIKAEDKLKGRSKKHMYLKAKDNNKRKQIKKPRYPDFEGLIKDNFRIKALSFEEQKERICKRKSTGNFVKSAYKCDYCFKGFKRELTYKSHMMKHSEESGKFACEMCHKRYTSKYTLLKHIREHTHLYSCVSCSFTTQDRGAAKLHLEWHKGKEYKCKVCEMVFLRSSTLLSHLRIKHPTDHVCHICGYSFLGAVGLYRHCRLKHRQGSREVSSDSPRCIECDISFISETALETHLEVSLRHNNLENLKRNESNGAEKKAVNRRRVKVEVPKNKQEANGDGMTITCEECGLLFFSWHAHRVHMGKQHRASLPVTNVRSGALCDVCGRVFQCAAQLRDHALVHSEAASYSCVVCGKSFKTRTSLQIHATRVHIETSSTYSCEVCGKSFKTQTTLQVHSRLHIESYSCPHCDRTFNQRSNWKRHLKNAHSDARNVKCDICEKLFKNERDRKMHVVHVHLKKPWPKRNRQRAKDEQTIARSKRGKGTTDDFCSE